MIVAPVRGARVDRRSVPLLRTSNASTPITSAADDRRPSSAMVSASPVATSGSSRRRSQPRRCVISSDRLDRLGGARSRPRAGASQSAPSVASRPAVDGDEEQEEQGIRHGWLATFVPAITRVETRNACTEHHIGATPAHRSDSPRERRGRAAPALEEGPQAARLAERLREHRPVDRVRRSCCCWATSLLAAATIALGFLLVDVLLPVHVIGHDDEAVNTWFAAHRIGTRNDLSFVGSSIGDIPFLPALVALEVIVAAALPALAHRGLHPRRDPDRGRDLPHREPDRAPRAPDRAAARPPAGEPELPLGPRGRVGRGLRRARAARDVALPAALGARRSPGPSHVLLPLVVATSRMYRGMHHPTDAAQRRSWWASAPSRSRCSPTRAADGVATLRAPAGRSA